LWEVFYKLQLIDALLEFFDFIVFTHRLGFSLEITQFFNPISESGKVKRMYAMGIENYSSRELAKIFTEHICENAKVVTDLWRGYRPLMKDYGIEQVPSNNGKNFPALHTMIHQVKS
jgi:enoyl-[acyl-carrier-protein] reductase (NADH)